MIGQGNSEGLEKSGIFFKINGCESLQKTQLLCLKDIHSRMIILSQKYLGIALTVYSAQEITFKKDSPCLKKVNVP